MLKMRAKSLTEFVAHSKYFFNDPTEYNSEDLTKGWKDESVNERVTLILEKLVNLQIWHKEDIERKLKLFSEEQDLSLGKIIIPIRLAICGTLNGPALFDILELIGKETTLKRINTALNSLPK